MRQVSPSTQAESLVQQVENWSQEQLIEQLKGMSWDELCQFQESHPGLITLEDDETFFSSFSVTPWLQKIVSRVTGSKPVRSSASSNLHP